MPDRCVTAKIRKIVKLIINHYNAQKPSTKAQKTQPADLTMKRLEFVLASHPYHKRISK